MTGVYEGESSAESEWLTREALFFKKGDRFLFLVFQFRFALSNGIVYGFQVYRSVVRESCTLQTAPPTQ